VVPCESVNLVESKSFKLYLGSFSNTRFADAEIVRERIRGDLNEAVWRGGPVQSSVGVRLLLPPLFDQEPVHELDGLSLDRLDVECSRYTPAPELLTAAFDEQPVTEVLTSNLLKSNCPVDRPARLGRRADQLQRPADRAGRAAAIPGELSQPQRVSRALRRAHLHGPVDALPAHAARGVRALHAPRRLDINPLRTSYPYKLPPNVRMARQ
jgi:Uncharacterized protein conserved in bacteria